MYIDFPDDWKDFLKKYSINSVINVELVEEMIKHYFLEKSIYHQITIEEFLNNL